MRRIVAQFEDAEAKADAEQALRESDLEPTEPAVDNAFFDPSIRMPESQGLLIGGLLGGLIGAVLLVAMDLDVFWIPRISPIMTAGRHALGFLGFAVGVAAGGFVGGVIGTAMEAPSVDRPRLAVVAPEHRVGEVEDLLDSHGATAIEGAAAYHEHPLRERVGGG